MINNSQEKKTFSNSNIFTKVFALGGLEEIGKNTYCIEYGDEIIIIDAGLKFPEKSLLGVEIIIPDYQYLIINQHKIKALFITHGHEDHIGGIPFLLKKVSIPKIYSPLLASDLIKLKLKKHLSSPAIIEFNEDTKVKIGHFVVTFFAVTHSVPNSFGIFIQTPDGIIATTGDFKLDWTPLNKKTSLHKISQMGNQGVDLLLSDSTNSEVSGYTVSEKEVLKNIEFLIKNTKKRILITTFASNFNRIFWIIMLSQKLQKKVLILGKAIKNIVDIVCKKKYFDLNKNLFLKEEEVKKYPPEKVVVICTGSQGEPTSVVSKIACSNHALIEGNEQDLIIFSSRPIPGNAFALENIINKLKKKGVEVQVSSEFNCLHTSGHACQEEQKIMLSLLKPTYFMPIHGEYRMLKIHGQTAVETGIDRKNVFICRNGDQIYLKNHQAWKGNYFPVQPVYIGKDYQIEESMQTLSDRQLMLQNGIIAIVIFVDLKNKKLWQSPKFIVRGSFYLKNESFFAQKLSEAVILEINENLDKYLFSLEKLSEKIRNLAMNLIYQEKKIHPLVHPIILTKNN